MTNSIDSSRPIMAPSTAAARFSTYSYQAPSLTGTIQTDNSAVAEIRDIATGLDRMENKALSSQRVILSEKKAENLGKLALGAKLDRALERRMTSQDAVMRPRGKSILLEKEKIQLNENRQQEADGANAAEGKTKEIESARERRRRQKLHNKKRRNYGETIKTRRQR